MVKKVGNRPTVGLFISELENAYTYNLCRGVIDAARKKDVNLIIFPGKSPKAPYEFQYQFNAIYELPDPRSIDALILATGTMINFLSHEEFETFYKRYHKIPLVSISIPLDGVSSVLINNRVGLKEAILHLTNDHKFRKIAFIGGPRNNNEAEERYQVYKDVLEECKIPFDPRMVYFGDFTHYSSVHAINQFIDERKISFEAIVAANDEMALSAMRVLKERGYRVPNDVAVVGFDNVESARFSIPSLTTVSQPIYEQAKKALHAALDLINGKPTANYMLATELVVRESCGCVSQTVNSIYAHEKRKSNKEENKNGTLPLDYAFCVQKPIVRNAVEKMLSELEKSLKSKGKGIENYHRFIQRFSEILNFESIDEKDILVFQNLLTDLRYNLVKSTPGKGRILRMEDFFHQARIILMEASLKINSCRWTLHHNDIRGLRIILNLLISDVYNRESTLHAIVPHMKAMGIKSCYIYLFENAVTHGITDPWKFPNKIRLAMSYSEHSNTLETADTKLVNTKSILNRKLFSGKQSTLVVSPLFYMNEQLGFIISEMSLLDVYLFESLAVEISCALKLTYLVKTRQEVEEKLRNALLELEEYNKKLNDISQTDELTGLLNRRGFLNRSRHDLDIARKIGKNGLLFFADLDGLKKINDSFGHKEGDEAIKAVAKILKKTFRDSDILARIGGDEFTVFAINTSMNMVASFQKRISLYLEEYNNTSGKPYKLSFSIGAVSFSARGSENIESLLNQADILLYNQKHQKKRAKKRRKTR